MRKALFLATLALTGLVSSSAFAADELGEEGQIALSADRIFGFNSWSRKIDNNGVEVKADGSTIGLVYNASPTPYTTPRLALDYFVIDGVSVGGSLGFGDDETVTTFVIAPRAGYDFPLADGVDLWLRGGFTYFSMKVDGADESANSFGIGAEAAFVFSPVQGFGIVASPSADLGLGGDVKFSNFGLNAGLVGWF